MAYDLDKRTSRIAGQTANKVFDISVAIVGLAFGAMSSTRRSRPSAPRRRKPRWW